jgi:3-methyl-2-oxobutanoate hydroxymethyltransferase
MNVLDFQKMKDEGRKISMVTCYDYSSARAVAESSIDCILVGDSVAMTMHGFSNTLAATTPMMALHTTAVARGASSKFIVADLPFLSYRKGLKEAMDSDARIFAAALVRACIFMPPSPWSDWGVRPRWPITGTPDSTM